MTDAVREALEGAARTLEVLGCYDGTMHENARILAKQDAEKLREALSALGEKDDGWLPIESAPRDDMLFLAATDDGRIMIWRGSILARNLDGPTPNHLSFPATHWRPLPAPPAAIRAGADDD